MKIIAILNELEDSAAVISARIGRDEFSITNISIDDRPNGLHVLLDLEGMSDDWEVRHGYYVTNEDGDNSCSVCHKEYIDCTKKYCPNRGARMDEKGGE